MSQFIIENVKDEQTRENVEKLLTHVYQNHEYTDKEVTIKPEEVCIAVKDSCGKKIIATGIIRLPNSYTRFESETFFEIPNDAYKTMGINRPNTVELGRFTCDKNDLAFFALNIAIILWMVNNGYDGWMAILKPDLAHTLKKRYPLVNFEDCFELKASNFEQYKSYFLKNGAPSVYYSDTELTMQAIEKKISLYNRLVKHSDI